LLRLYLNYMCRLLAIKGKISQADLAFVLGEFKKQAVIGRVPHGVKPGHRDGWGFSVYQKGKVKIYERSNQDASQDKKYDQTVNKILKIDSQIIIGHLRKASVGENNAKNNHPFVYKNFSFCHNGKILESDKIKIKAKFKKSIKGSTDSERLFYFILGNLTTSIKLKVDFIKAIKKIKKDFDYTGLNLLFSNGRKLIAIREVNLKNKVVKEKKMLGYYGLFVGINKKYSYQIVASEKIKLPGTSWRLMKNAEIIEL